MTTVQSSRIVGAIAKAIAPYIGEMMAHSSIDMHCRKIGITSTIDHLQFEELLRRLGLGLNIFIGRDKTAAVLAQIRSGVEIQA